MELTLVCYPKDAERIIWSRSSCGHRGLFCSRHDAGRPGCFVVSHVYADDVGVGGADIMFFWKDECLSMVASLQWYFCLIAPIATSRNYLYILLHRSCAVNQEFIFQSWRGVMLTRSPFWELLIACSTASPYIFRSWIPK